MIVGYKFDYKGKKYGTSVLCTDNFPKDLEAFDLMKQHYKEARNKLKKGVRND